MSIRFLVSPAYVLSVIGLVAGAVLVGTPLIMLGWMVFIVGLALNVLALVVLVNRRYLLDARAPASASEPDHGAEDRQTLAGDTISN